MVYKNLKMSEIPKAIQKLASESIYTYSLLLWLDKKAYVEINDDDFTRFCKLVERWKKENGPTLERSNYMVYLVKDGDIAYFDL